MQLHLPCSFERVRQIPFHCTIELPRLETGVNLLHSTLALHTIITAWRLLVTAEMKNLDDGCRTRLRVRCFGPSVTPVRRPFKSLITPSLPVPPLISHQPAPDYPESITSKLVYCLLNAKIIDIKALETCTFLISYFPIRYFLFKMTSPKILVAVDFGR